MQAPQLHDHVGLPGFPAPCDDEVVDRDKRADAYQHRANGHGGRNDRRWRALSGLEAEARPAAGINVCQVEGEPSGSGCSEDGDAAGDQFQAHIAGPESKVEDALQQGMVEKLVEQVGFHAAHWMLTMKTPLRAAK